MEYWEDGNYDDDQTIVKNSFKISNSGSEKLAGTNLSGFFFYRGKRCINFGGDLENNQGFYDLISPQQKNWVYRLRVKIEYSERVLDDKFELHPNKKGYIEIDDEIWNQIKLALSMHIGGNQFARPFSQSRAFVLWKVRIINFVRLSQMRIYFLIRGAEIVLLRFMRELMISVPWLNAHNATRLVSVVL